MSLYHQFLTNDGRVIHKWKHYFPAYEQHIGRYRSRPALLFEIGCGKGGSLQMWKRWLGPHIRIVGIDIEKSCKSYEEDQIHVRIGSQDDAAFLRSVVKEFGTPDVVIDDGSHVMSHIAKTFDVLYPLVDRAGVYLIEDLHTAYWEEFEGGLRRPGTMIERAKDLVDALNADHTRGGLRPDDFTRTTLSMHFYDSVVVFERGAHTEKWAPQIGTPPVQD